MKKKKKKKEIRPRVYFRATLSDRGCKLIINQCCNGRRQLSHVRKSTKEVALHSSPSIRVASLASLSKHSLATLNDALCDAAPNEKQKKKKKKKKRSEQKCYVWNKRTVSKHLERDTIDRRPLTKFRKIHSCWMTAERERTIQRTYCARLNWLVERLNSSDDEFN